MSVSPAVDGKHGGVRLGRRDGGSVCGGREARGAGGAVKGFTRGGREEGEGVNRSSKNYHLQSTPCCAWY